MKKYILSFVLMMTISSIVFSQSAQPIQYQAIVRDTAGALLANQNVAVRISILCDSINGTTVYSETHNVNANKFGLINISIGAGTVLSGIFSSIDWSKSSFLKTEIDAYGGVDYQLMRITRLLSVPYALHTSGLILTDANGQSYHVEVDTDGNLSTIMMECTPQPSQANAGPDQLYLPDTITTLQANTPTSGTGNWSVVSGEGGVIEEIDNPVSSFSGTTDNTYELVWTISTLCGSTSDTVIIDFFDGEIINIPVDYSTIQAGINAASEGGIVLVDTGTYIENIDFIGKGIIVASLFLTTQDTSFISQTIIDDDGNSGTVVTFNNDEDSTAVLTGFTVTNGHTGISCNSSSPSVSNNIIIGNTNVGINCYSASPLIYNNSVHDNTGYGIHCDEYSSPVISHNSINNNTNSGIYCNENSSPSIFYNVVSFNDEGIYCSHYSHPVISNNVINGNAGGIHCSYYCDPVISKNMISGNNSGNGIYLFRSSPSFYNNLVSNFNQGFYCWFGSTPTILNNIFYENQTGINATNEPASLEYNLFWLNMNNGFGLVPASFGVIDQINSNSDSCDVYNNLFMDPVFVDPDNTNFYLSEISPCIDAANPDPVYSDPDGSIADIGALCFDSTMVPLTADFLASITWGDSPLTVQFDEFSFGYPDTWEWDFQNDGTIDSYDQNPEWIFTESGIYTVSLTVTDVNGSTDTKIRKEYIVAYADHVDPLITTDNWQSHTWPYNAYYPLTDNPDHRHGVVNGHVAASCGPTAVSRILHYWEFPIQGDSSLTYTDVYGCQYSADFGNTTYDWENMQFILNNDDPESVYGPTATLFYHVATSVHDVNVYGGTAEMWIEGLTTYMCYSSSAQKVQRNQYTREEWISIYKNEFAHGRPIYMSGYNSEGGGHWFICDGYNEEGDFHFLMSWGGTDDGYYDIDDPNGYSIGKTAIIGLEPGLNGKELELMSPNGGEIFLADADTTITWYCENIDTLKIEYTIDNGENWLEIISSTPATGGTYTWTTPDTASAQCMVKLTDVTDPNAFVKSNTVFSIASYDLILLVPNGGELYLPESTVLISWAPTTTSDIKIEYTIDNGSLWYEIADDTATSIGSFNWVVPDSISDQCKVKITDVTDGTNFDESDNTFEIATEISHALQFDGINDLVITPLIIDQGSGSAGVTMEAWVYPTSTGGFRHQVICTDDGGYDWAILREGDDWCVFTGSGSVNTGFSVDLNTWQHLAAVFVPGTGVKFYKDGVELIISSIATDESNGVIGFGHNPGFAGEVFTGMIDEARVWDHPRSQSEIQAKRNQYLTGTESGLDGYWRMNEGFGQTAVDLSGNGNDGQLGSTSGEDGDDPLWIETNWPYVISDLFNCGDPFTDLRDNQIYNTVLIDTMCWMAENLNIGTVIDNGTGQTDNGIIEKYCSYNGIEDSCDVYGGLYQWNEMMQYSTTPGIQGVCPAEWHVPTDEEWKVLEGTVDSQFDVGDVEWDGDIVWRGFDAGEKLKATSGWGNDGNGTDDYGFSMIPGSYQGESVWIWTSSEANESNAWVRKLESVQDGVFRRSSYKTYADVVRCINNCTPQPSQADAGLDQLNVASTSTTLAGNTPTSGTGNWSVISGAGGTITDAASPTTSFSGLEGNSYELTWTITAYCGSSADTVIISFAGADGVMKVTSDVAIDGLLEESFWDISNQVSINLGGSDNTASFGVLWDDTYLYVGVNVVDGTLCTNGRMGWNDDGVEICIDGDYSRGTTFDEYDRHFIKPVKSYWIQEKDGQLQVGVIHQWIETNDGYSMEFAIPWDNFNVSPAVGMNIGLNVAINDDDNCSSGGSLSHLLWSGDANYYKNSANWGTINLSDQTVSYTEDYLALVTPNGGNFYINNKTADIKWVSHGITNINIDYSTDNGANWSSVVTNITASSGSYSWNVSATASDQCLLKIYDANNSSTNDISKSPFAISGALTPVEPLIPNIWDNYQWPYNAYYPEDPDGINGHVGNACGPSSLARILHYWEFPIVGNDELTFTDNAGFTWSANFGQTTYNYDNMPPFLPGNSTEPEYTDVATLFYHAATSMHDIGGSGTDLDNMSYAMSHYFNYKESDETLRSGYTRAEWIQTVMNELDNGRVLLVQGMALGYQGNWHENDNIAGHWYHCDGYNEDGDLHIVIGYGDYDYYYDADSLSDFAYNLGILTGLEPDLNDKELSIVSPDGGEIFLTDGDTTITWTSTNISDIKIEYTIDNGDNWLEIIASTPASAGTYTWTVPDTTSYQCKVKLTDVTEVNVYDKSDDVFIISTYELSLTIPNGGECYIPGNSVSIGWEDTPVSDIKIEYSTDNGSNWVEIIDETSTSTGSYDWIIPDSVSDLCKVKITDISDGTVYDESDNTFEITDEASNALQFDGTDDYVEVTGILFPTDDLTIEAWINPNEFDGIQEIIFWFGDNSIQFRTQADSSLLYGEAAGSWNYVISSSQSLLPNEWTHVAVTKQGDQCNLYINGIHAAYSQFDNDPVAAEISIGGRSNNMDRFFDGDVDEVRIWTVARTQAEIQANMYNYLMGTVTGLYACWRLNEGAGQTTFDLTANGYDGQLGSTTGADDSDPVWIETDWPYNSTGGFSCGDPLTDTRDLQVYATVQIGTQCWMAENINIGSRIDGGVDATDDETIEKYCYSDDELNCAEYGGLYQWNEMMEYSTTEGVQGICPDGWSLPTDDEWKTLEGAVDANYPVGDPIWDNTGWRGFDAGKNLKSVSGWSSNTGTDLYGFTALPGGMIEGSVFKDLIGYAYFWTSTENGSNSWFRALAHNRDDVYRSSFSKAFGCSVRCLMD